MLPEAFNAYFSRRPASTLVLEDNTGIIKHLTHLEEYILTRKQAGLTLALNFLDELYKTFKGHTNTSIYTTIKYDGAPAIIAGFNPENNRFFVSTKSVANVNPKINYTPEDVDINHGNQPDLAKKLKLALQYLPNTIKQGVYQGDFMFDQDSKKIVSHEGENLIIFKPNTIVYAVPVESALGERIKNARIGIVFHTKYTGSSLSQLSKSSDVNSSEFNETSDAWVEDAKFKDVSGVASFTDEEEDTINTLKQEVLKANSVVSWDKLPNDFFLLANTFINTLIREGRFVEDPTKAYDEFITWVTKKLDTSIDKLKTPGGKLKAENNKNATLQGYEKDKLAIVNIFDLTKKLEALKMLYVKKYNQAIKTKQFLVQPDGSLKVTNPEGYVAVDHEGNMIKLVDRLEFSRANFALSKGEKFK